MITNKKMNAIAIYMDDVKREYVHNEIAPCSNETFIRRYLEIDPGFAETLKSEFSIDF